ncbi:MAG: MarR family transcriptional regulator for hemolysin [Motiliproteus sp.]|jgi:MarR family transcriptional regulator for hemolysin
MSIKQPEICLAHCLRRADRVISQLYNDHLAPLGLRITQFSVLRALHYLRSTTATQIQDVLTMEQATISRALKPLIRDGYVTVAEGSNKREKLLSLSASGQQFYQQALVPWQQAQAEIRHKLGPDIDHSLIELSQQIVAIKR